MAVVIKTTFLHLCETREAYDAKSPASMDGSDVAQIMGKVGAGVASDLDIGVVRCAGVEQVGQQFLCGDDC